MSTKTAQEKQEIDETAIREEGRDEKKETGSKI